MANREQIQYEDRLIVFMDLLGFSNAVKQSENQNVEELTERIYSIIDFFSVQESVNAINNRIKDGLDKQFEVYFKMKGTPEAVYDNPLSAAKEITFFSDCLVISCKKEKKNNGYLKFLMGLNNMLFNVISKGFLLRGGMTYGKLFHKNNQCFGPAMLKAYYLENNVANYPRIIVDKAAVAELNNYGLNNYLIKDKMDGIDLFDYLSQKAYFEENDNYHDIEGNRLDYNQFLKNLKILITDNLEQYNDNERVLIKYQWYKEYYNDTVKKVLCQEQQDEFLIK